MNGWSEDALERLVLSMIIYSGVGVIALLFGGLRIFGLSITLVLTCFMIALIANEMTDDIIPATPVRFIVWVLTLIPCALSNALLWFMKALDRDIDRGGENDD